MMFLLRMLVFTLLSNSNYFFLCRLRTGGPPLGLDRSDRRVKTGKRWGGFSRTGGYRMGGFGRTGGMKTGRGWGWGGFIQFPSGRRPFIIYEGIMYVQKGEI